jgi:8-amino-3,8-dideoxy-alpha-D-manno-octulosonate transaminase
MAHSPAHDFFAASSAAVADLELRRKLENATGRHLHQVGETRSEFPSFDAERDAARQIKEDAIGRLDELLIELKNRLEANGCKVFVAADAAEARSYILEVAKRRRIRVLEDCAQAMGASYKGRPVGSLGDIGIYSMQINKTITSGEGGAVVTNDPVLFERASRYHDLGALRPLHEHQVGGPKVEAFAGSQFRMSEFTGGVLLAQLRKLDRIVDSVRSSARRVYDGIRDLPGIQLRGLPDPEGELGAAVFVGFDSKATCDRFRAAMKAENVPASLPGGSAILPIAPHVEHKRTVHPAWPSFTSERGRAIRYGAECCPRTLDILSRFAGVSLDPTFTRNDTDDIVAAIRKVYPQVVRA